MVSKDWVRQTGEGGREGSPAESGGERGWYLWASARQRRQHLISAKRPRSDEKRAEGGWRGCGDSEVLEAGSARAKLSRRGQS